MSDRSIARRVNHRDELCRNCDELCRNCDVRMMGFVVGRGWDKEVFKPFLSIAKFCEVYRCETRFSLYLFVLKSSSMHS